MLATLAFTFTNLTLSQEEPLRFVGFENYADLAADAQAWDSLSVTLRFAVLWLPVVVILSPRHRPPSQQLLDARFRHVPDPLLPALRGSLRGRGPHLADDAGRNRMDQRWPSLMGVSDPPSWLNDTTWIHPALVIMGLWGIGAGIIVNTAGLQGIPTELYDAAKIDGAGWWAQLRYVTLPMMSPVTFYILILGVVEVMQYFLVPLVDQQRDRGTGRLHPLLQPLSVQDVLHLSGDGLRRHAGVAPFRGDPGGDVPPLQVVPPVGVLRRRTVS